MTLTLILALTRAATSTTAAGPSDLEIVEYTEYLTAFEGESDDRAIWLAESDIAPPPVAGE